MTSRPVVLLARSALLPALAEADAIIGRSRGKLSGDRPLTATPLRRSTTLEVRRSASGHTRRATELAARVAPVTDEAAGVPS